MLNKDKALKETERQKQATLTNALIIGFVLVLIFAIYIFRSYRMKQKANKIIETQKQEVERQKELVEEKQKAMLDSIHYARRIQQSLLPTEKYIEKNIRRLKNKS